MGHEKGKKRKEKACSPTRQHRRCATCARSVSGWVGKDIWASPLRPPSLSYREKGGGNVFNKKNIYTYISLSVVQGGERHISLPTHPLTLCSNRFQTQYNIMQNIPATQRIESIRTKHPRWCVYRVTWRDGKYAPREVVMLSARMADKLQHGHAMARRFKITFVGRTGTTVV